MGLVILWAGARRTWRLLLLVGVVFAALPAGSSLADTTIGQVGGSAGCANPFNTGAMYGDLGYRVPSGGGRITSFSTQSAPVPSYQVDFLVLRPAGASNNYTVVGQTGLVTLKGTGLETFQVTPPGIPVQGGDILGFWFSLGLPNCYRFGPGPTTFKLPAPEPKTGVSIAMAPPSAGADLNESATLVTSVAGLSAPAPHFLKVSPTRTNPGKTITVSGSVGNRCQSGHRGDTAAIYSNAFKGATKRRFAGVPAVYVSLSKSKTGRFSFKLKLSKKLKTGTYAMRGRCRGRNFGSAKLKLVKAP